MAERRVSVRFSAEIQGFKAAMAEAAASTRKVKDSSEEASKAADTHLGRLVESATKNRDAWETTGATFLGLGTAAVAGLGLAGKAAMDWESAWAGVTKTVDGTPAQMDELEVSLRGLAKTLPATHEEIAGVAEAAGQLGVKREDVVGFTETMIALGETTNLTADEAATSIAQISNVMGTMEREGSEGVERFSSTLVALGNAGASTEAEIVDMAQRIAGAGKLVGASESDVLALANAMASVGIESQLGGGVISRVMQRMYADVKTGGEGLEGLAQVAGVSSKEFATAFETDPVRAVDMVVKGLGRVKDEGGNVVQTMADLGIKGTEETSVLLRLAGAGDLLSDSLKLGDEAWQSNSALAEEAAKRYETTEAKVQIAWNNIKDAAIEAGAVLLPIIAGGAESVAGIAQAFGSLPDPVKGALSVLGGVAGVAALGAGAFLTLTPKILDSMEAFNKLAPAGGKARSALAGVGKAAGAAAALATVTVVLAKMAESDDMSKIDTGMGKVALALAEVTSNSPGAASALDGLFKDRDGGDLINTVTDLESAIKRTFDKDAGQSFNDWGEGLVNSMTGVKGSSQILADQFGRLDQGLADLVSGGKADDAAKTFDQIRKAAEDQGVSVEQLAEKFPQYADALKSAEADAKNAATESDKAAGAIEGVGTAADGSAGPTEEVAEALADLGVDASGAAVDLEKFTAALFASGLRTMSAREATAAHQAAIDGTKGAVQEATKAIEDQLIAEGMGEEAAKALAAEQYKLGGALNKSKTDFDLTTEAGRILNTQFQTVASTGMAEIEAKAKAGAGQPELQKNLKSTYDSLITAGKGMGLTGGDADTLARKVMGVPKKANINTWMSSEAKRMAEETKGAVDRIPPVKNVTINTYRNNYERNNIENVVTTSHGRNNTGGRQGTKATYQAEGGAIVGPGTGTSDDVPAWLSNGEHVLTAAEVQKMGGQDAVYRWRQSVMEGSAPKFAMGGAVGDRHGREYSAQQLGHAPFAATGITARVAGGTTFGDVIITEQKDPVATWHEFARRTRMLGT